MKNATHTFHFGSKNNRIQNPHGVPVVVGRADEAFGELQAWHSDAEGNIAGYANPNGSLNHRGSFVQPLVN